MDHRRRLLGVSGTDLRCPRRKLGLLRDRVLCWGRPRHPHPSGQETPCCGRRVGRAQVHQDRHICNLCLLLVLLCRHLCHGGLRCHRSRILSHQILGIFQESYKSHCYNITTILSSHSQLSNRQESVFQQVEIKPQFRTLSCDKTI